MSDRDSAAAGELAILMQLQDRLRSQQDELFRQQQELHTRGSLPALASTRSFTQGLVVGQLSVILVLCVFVKFFVFADGSASLASGAAPKADASKILVNRKKASDSDTSGDSAADDVDTILEKTYYDVANHLPESLDWFNVLVAQTISLFRSEALHSDNIYHSLRTFLAALDMPDYLGDIQLTEIDIGDDFPIFSNCRIRPSDNSPGRLEANIDVDLSDTLTMGVQTKLILNQPRPMTAVLPIQLSISIVRFSGCLTVSLINTSDEEFADFQSRKKHMASATEAEESNGAALLFSFSPDYRLEFSVKSLIGSRAKLENVPKISALIESRLRSWFVERCIEPRFQVVRLPSLWPRKKNTMQTGEGS